MWKMVLVAEVAIVFKKSLILDMIQIWCLI